MRGPRGLGTGLRYLVRRITLFGDVGSVVSLSMDWSAAGTKIPTVTFMSQASLATRKFAHTPMYDERFARQHRYEPPSEFPLNLPFTSIVHHLSGPNRRAHNQTSLS